VTAATNEFTFSTAVFWQQRVCAGCGDPGSEAHHVVLRSHGGEHHIDCGLLLCNKCHRGFHDGQYDIQKDIGKGLLEWPEKVAYVHEVLGDRADSYLLRYYRIEAP